MPLVTIADLTIRFRGPPLLDGVNCLIDNGQRIGLLGRNGAGKTTFLRLLAGTLAPDNGAIIFAPGAKVALLQQDVPQDLTGEIAEIVMQGVSRKVQHTGDESDWQRQHAVDQILSRMELDGHERFEILSSGMKRRVLLARALVGSPDLLLLDEPTNHLDIDAIEWLENFLSRWQTAFMFITHDRMFLRKLASRILEIDGGRLFDWSCDYDTFLKRKEEALAAEEKQNALFDKKLAQEEVWIRQGVKARRTRNEGRVRALKELRLIRGERRAKTGTTNLKIQEGMRSGNLVVHATDLCVAYGDRQILQDFSTTIMRGDKIGIVGRNGVGKTTLLKSLLGELKPDSGNVRLGTNLQVAYFDQLRAQLRDTSTVEDEVGDGYKTVEIAGKKQHIIGYLQDFLFTPERARTPIKQLSGGERNRVLLAKLFAKPANVIVLDEPTNDLDAETLEMLEERLIQYQGTLLVVSHDREFLNNVVTSCLVFEDGGVREYVGGYDDWLRQSLQPKETNLSSKNNTDREQQSQPALLENSGSVGVVVKLSFKEKQELERIPKVIEEMETTIAAKHEEMSQPDYYKQPKNQLMKAQSMLEDLKKRLAETYRRWEELEARR